MKHVIAAAILLGLLVAPFFVPVFVPALAAPPLLAPGLGEAGQQSAHTLDYEYFKKNVQPIFLEKRPGHARCVACHIGATPMNLTPMATGATAWTEEETKKNFAAVQKVAVAGNPRSMLLIHPLEESAGGDFYHSGGKHWTSQSDPEWQLLRTFVMGQTK
jgi:hypothetical protein